MLRMDDKGQITLFVRHLPSQLTTDDQKELLMKFGARQVKAFGTKKGPLKHTAYALFGDRAVAEQALKRLHQLELCGRRLFVEYAKNNDVFNQLAPPKLASKPEKKDNGSTKDTQKASIEPDVKGVSEKIDSVCSKWNVSYPLHPRLKYSYPPPSVSILTNIANALATVPKFYVQVLHLMNRFNLPAPFGEVTPTPPLPDNLPPPLPVEPEIRPAETGNNIEQDTEEIEEAEMAISSSEESELESSDDGEAVKKVTVFVKRKANII